MCIRDRRDRAGADGQQDQRETGDDRQQGAGGQQSAQAGPQRGHRATPPAARMIRAEACPVTVSRFSPIMPRNVVWYVSVVVTTSVSPPWMVAEPDTPAAAR